MGVHWDGRTEVEKLAKTIKELQDQVKALSAGGSHIPVVDVDPTDDYGNVWYLYDNRLRIRRPDGTIAQVALTVTGSGTSGTALPAPPAQPKTLQGTWSAAWSQTYRGNGDPRSESLLHVGNSNSDTYNGTQVALIGWPYATIAAALAGSTVTKVEVYLYATHCYWNAGSTISVLSQVNTAAPGALGGVNSGILNDVHVKGSDQGGEPDAQRWKVVSTTFGGWLRDGISRGFALQARSSNRSYYAILGGVGSNAPAPKIRITYVK